ncbi:MAG: nuclear transport factor 2 family protein [Acidimicrobiales bacterium]
MTSPQPSPAWARHAGRVTVAPQTADTDPARTADRLMIAERIARYGWGYDERDRALLADCFTADGVWEGSVMGGDPVGPFVGRDAVADFLAEFWAIQTDQRRHVFTNVVVESIAGDRAVAHAYLILTASAEATMNVVTNGPYRFELLRETDGVWRMTKLSAGFDAPF